MNIKEIIKRVYDCENLEDIEQTDKYIYAYDNQEGKDIYFKFLEDINFEDLFDFGSQEVDKEKFFNLLRSSLDNNLFIIPNKLYFINNQEELDNILDKFKNDSFDIENMVGMNLYFENCIFINMYLIKKLTLEECDMYKDIDYEEELNISTWQTIIHELRHMLCDSCIIISEEEVPIAEGAEDKVEEYCINTFEENIENLNFCCFK